MAGDVGLPATNRFTGEPKRDQILNPHLDNHRERLAEQIVRKSSPLMRPARCLESCLFHLMNHYENFHHTHNKFDS